MSGFLWIAASAGALSLIAPCVLPALPLTTGYFAQRRATSGSTALAEAALFALGIVASFTGLGLALAALVGAGALGRLAADPWVNIVIAAMFVVFALSLVGTLDLALPASWIERADRGSRAHARRTGPLLMGVAFTLVTFTCTAPFVGSLLVAASAGDWKQPVAGMLVYSIVFAIPFFLLALAPRAAQKLPRSGRWMTDVRMALAAIELAVAIKFIANAAEVWGSSVFSRERILLAWVILAGSIGGLIMWRARSSQTTGSRMQRFAFGAIALMGTAWLTTGLRGRPMGVLEALLPSARATEVSLPWIVNDLDGALARGRTLNRPVLVDFTGYTCGNCRWMESHIFSRVTVQRAMQPYVLARLYTDGEGAIYEKQQRIQQDMFGTVALPFYAVLDASGRSRATFVGVTRDSEKFVRFLRSAGAAQ